MPSPPSPPRDQPAIPPLHRRPAPPPPPPPPRPLRRRQRKGHQQPVRMDAAPSLCRPLTAMHVMASQWRSTLPSHLPPLLSNGGGGGGGGGCGGGSGGGARPGGWAGWQAAHGGCSCPVAALAVFLFFFFTGRNPLRPTCSPPMPIRTHYVSTRRRASSHKPHARGSAVRLDSARACSGRRSWSKDGEREGRRRSRPPVHPPPFCAWQGSLWARFFVRVQIAWRVTLSAL